MTSRIDVFFLTRFQGTTSTGLYAAAIQLCSVMPIVIGAISTVLLPQVSRYTKRVQFVSYVKKVTFGAVVLTVVLLPVIIWGESVINLIFGDKYNASFVAFQIMFVGYLVALFANPISLVMYGLNKPAKLTVVNYVQLVVSFVLNLVLIPVWGIEGAATAFLVVNLIGGIGSVYYSLRLLRTVPE
jgi:O-antigen/teichoic acid export membrane protein